MSVFAERLKILRLTRSLRQSDVAEIMGVSTRIASYYEAGRHLPKDIQVYINLSKRFNVSIDWLLGNDARTSNTLIPKRVMDFVTSDTGQEMIDIILEAGLTVADIKCAVALRS